VRHQNWKFFSRSECLRCHTIWNNFTPGFTGVQLKGPADGVFSTLAFDVKEKKPLADPYGSEGSPEWKARSYLHVNCSVCHRVAGGGAVRSFMNIEEPLKNSRLLNEKPVLGGLGLTEARVIAPGDPGRCVMLYRMSTGGRGHMPYLGGKLIDDAGIMAVRNWVTSLPKDDQLPPAIAKETADEEKWLADSAAGNHAALAKLLESSSGCLRVALSVIDGSLKGEMRTEAIALGSALPDPLKRDLFERFLPPEQRRKVLGPNFKAEPLLAMKGDAMHGKEMFSAICATCHRADGVGADFGPDLSKIASKWNRPLLLEQIVQPGKVIDPEWNLTTVTMPDGETVSGYVAERSDQGITLKLPGGERKKLAPNEIKASTSARASIMPQAILEKISPQQAADLLEFLSSRK
jgi:putative heme-binding domain-containing protein